MVVGDATGGGGSVTDGQGVGATDPSMVAKGEIEIEVGLLLSGTLNQDDTKNTLNDLSNNMPIAYPDDVKSGNAMQSFFNQLANLPPTDSNSIATIIGDLFQIL